MVLTRSGLGGGLLVAVVAGASLAGAAAASAPAGAMKVDVCGSAKFKPGIVYRPSDCKHSARQGMSVSSWSTWTRQEALGRGAWKAAGKSWAATVKLDRASENGFARMTVTFAHAHPSGLGRVAVFTLPTLHDSSLPAPAATAPATTAPATTAPTTHACTTTSSGSCIRGGEFCPVASEGQYGYDASGDRYECEDVDGNGHPHWEPA